MEKCNCIFQKFDSLICSIESIEKKLEKSNLDNQDVTKNLNLEGAIKFLNQNGFFISKSSIYKLTSTNSIPFKRFGNKLFFVESELLSWASSKLYKKENNEAILMSKVATKKLNKRRVK